MAVFLEKGLNFKFWFWEPKKAHPSVKIDADILALSDLKNRKTAEKANRCPKLHMHGNKTHHLIWIKFYSVIGVPNIIIYVNLSDDW